MAMGCTVQANQHGNLFLRIYYRGEEWSEGRWGLMDNAADRKSLEAKALIIGEEMKAGTFDYLKWFPEGNKAALYRQEKQRGRVLTIAEYYEEWKKDKVPPFVKKTRGLKYRSHFRAHIIRAQGDRFMHTYSFSDLRELRSIIVEDSGAGMKTAKNIINATLRAFFRDAVAEGILPRSPFDDVPDRWWPQTPPPPPDPFTEDERDEILAYLKDKYYGWWPSGYAFTYALFWTGARPSELTARRWRDYDPRTGMLFIHNSRTLGEEGATKTSKSRRTIKLFDPVRALLKQLMPLRIGPDDYIFNSQRGQPVNQSNFAEDRFWPALRALSIRHRPFYHTRSTFISALLTHGATTGWVGAYVATSPKMLEDSYAKWIGRDDNFIERATGAKTRDLTRDQARNSKKKNTVSS